LLPQLSGRTGSRRKNAALTPISSCDKLALTPIVVVDTLRLIISESPSNFEEKQKKSHGCAREEVTHQSDGRKFLWLPSDARFSPGGLADFAKMHARNLGRFSAPEREPQSF